MKRLSIFAIVLLMVGMFSTCKKETTISFKDVPEINGGDDIADGTVSYTLSVQVIPSSDKARVSGLDGAKVTVNSAGGTSTVTTGVDGIAVFSGLPGTGGVAGNVSVYVDAGSGFAKRNIIVGLPLSLVSDADQTTLVQAQIIMPRLGASLVGTIYGDFNNDGNTNSSETIAGVNVRVGITNTIQPNVYETTTAADGTFRIDSLPENTATSTVISVTYSYDDGNNGVYFRIAGNPSLVAGTTSDNGITKLPRTSQSMAVNISGRIYGNFAYDTCAGGGTGSCQNENKSSPGFPACCAPANITKSSHYVNGITIKLTYVSPSSLYGDVYTTTTKASGSKNGFFEFTNLPEEGTVNIEVDYNWENNLWFTVDQVQDKFYADYNFTTALNNIGVTIDPSDDYLGSKSLSMTTKTKP